MIWIAWQTNMKWETADWYRPILLFVRRIFLLCSGQAWEKKVSRLCNPRSSNRLPNRIGQLNVKLGHFSTFEAQLAFGDWLSTSIPQQHIPKIILVVESLSNCLHSFFVIQKKKLKRNQIKYELVIKWVSISARNVFAGPIKQCFMILWTQTNIWSVCWFVINAVRVAIGNTLP